jgi:hypothetical protein
MAYQHAISLTTFRAIGLESGVVTLAAEEFCIGVSTKTGHFS